MHRKGVISIHVRERGEIAVHRCGMIALGNPLRLEFWWNSTNKMLFVSAADAKSPASIPVPSSCRKTTKNGVKFTHKDLLNAISALAGWKKGSAHILTGEYITELRMIAFKTVGAIAEEGEKHV
jgi:hypothetical protein